MSDEHFTVEKAKLYTDIERCYKRPLTDDERTLLSIGFMRGASTALAEQTKAMRDIRVRMQA